MTWSLTVKIAWMLVITGVAVSLTAAGLANREVLPAVTGFGFFVLGVGLAAAGGILGFISLFGNGGAAGAAALVVGLVPLLVVAGALRDVATHPVINDVTTDREDPPPLLRQRPGREFQEALTYPQHFLPHLEEAYGDLGPKHLKVTPRQAFDKVLELVQETPGWEVVDSDLEGTTLQGLTVSNMFRFRDDFVIRVRATPEGSRIDMRSRSRDGHSDLGKNGERIRWFFSRLDG